MIQSDLLLFLKKGLVSFCRSSFTISTDFLPPAAILWTSSTRVLLEWFCRKEIDCVAVFAFLPLLCGRIGLHYIKKWEESEICVHLAGCFKRFLQDLVWFCVFSRFWIVPFPVGSTHWGQRTRTPASSQKKNNIALVSCLRRTLRAGAFGLSSFR